jgi:hypothetical protein
MHGREERYISSTALDLLRATMDVRFAKIDTQFAEVDTKLSDLKLWIIVTLISVVGLGLSIAGLLFYRGH